MSPRDNKKLVKSQAAAPFSGPAADELPDPLVPYSTRIRASLKTQLDDCAHRMKISKQELFMHIVEMFLEQQAER